MDIFEGEDFVKFIERFDTDLTCKQYLSDIKWENGYKCNKCSHKRYSLRPDHSRVCTKCKHVESTTANTMFHNVKFGIRKAFLIVFEMTATSKGISSSQASKRYGVTRKTAWLFMHKVRISMKSSMNMPIKGRVQVDEFTIGGKENLKVGRSKNIKKKKVVCAVELTDEDKVKRVYSLSIPDYSSKSLVTIFEKHISKIAKVTTDEWTGYKPLMKDYDITQIPSLSGMNFKQLHHIIHQIKTWTRTIYSWVHKQHIDKYLDEYSFRINRSIYKQTIFHKLIERIVYDKPLSYMEIISVGK